MSLFLQLCGKKQINANIAMVKQQYKDAEEAAKKAEAEKKKGAN